MNGMIRTLSLNSFPDVRKSLHFASLEVSIQLNNKYLIEKTVTTEMSEVIDWFLDSFLNRNSDKIEFSVLFMEFHCVYY